MIRRILPVAFGALALTGCLVGPNYKRPQIATPDQFHGAPPSDQPAVSIADTKWFDLFHDDALACELRYFEIAPGGHSTLERHDHLHSVMIIRGGAG